MALSIHTNYSSLVTQTNLGKTNNALGTNQQRLGTGLRINSAKDDAAGLAISEGLRQEVGGDIRVTLVSPGVTESELAESISDDTARSAMDDFRRIAIPADAIARAIAYAIDQPADVDVSELVVRPTASPY